MKPYPIWKPITVLIVLALCALMIYPPQTRLKPGLDLAGGTTLIYNVLIPEGETGNASQIVDDVIAILQQRVDPTGTRNLVWRQQAGNRIEIQMALSTAKTKDLRTAYETAMEALLEGNIEPGSLDSAMRLDGDERADRLKDLSKGDQEKLEQLVGLAIASDAIADINEPYRQALSYYQQASATFEALPVNIDEAQRESARQAMDQAFAEMSYLANEVANARDRYQAMREAVLDQNIEAFEMRAAFRQSDDASAKDELSPRDRVLEEIREDYPSRVEQIDKVVEQWELYEQVKGRLDDPNDLIALLQKSGVLEFRIAPMPAENLLDEDDYREQLEEDGPLAGIDRPYRWFEVESLERYVDEPADREAIAANPAAGFSSVRRVIGAEYRGAYYVLLSNTGDKAMTQEEEWALSDAYRTVDNGMPAVGFNMNPQGAAALSRITRGNSGRPMAILLDGKVITSPNLNSELSSRGIITGNFTEQYRDDLVLTLDSGSLSAQLGEEPILIKTTGPQLGADNLRAGVTAAGVSLIVVAVFMVFYYFFAGIVATIALAANMLIILGLMALIQATFTLPGIAGIVLTIGMAVDANVLIFERIREELKSGAKLDVAVRLGFDKAFSTIVDANITTFLTCLVLFYTATTEIKGFATTLMCGILATMFTSLVLSRVIMDGYLRLLKAKKLPMLPTVVPMIGKALSPNVNWIAKRYGFFFISAVLTIAGFSMLFVRGVDMLDIEFRSGTQVSFVVDRDLEGRTVTPNEQTAREVPLVPIEEVRARLALAGPAQLVAQGEGSIPEGLDAKHQRVFESLVQVARNYSERYDQEVKAFAENPDDVDPVGEKVDFADFAGAAVVTQGQTVGSLASEFSISTLIQDAPLVSDVVKAAFDDLLDQPPTARFADMDRERIDAAPVYPVVNVDADGNAILGLSIDRLDVLNPVDEYLGGVVVMMDDITPALTAEAMDERVSRMRRQPPYDELGYRKFDIIGIDSAGVDEQGKTLYRSAAVLVSDRQTNYREGLDGFDAVDGLAVTEWALIRDAMTRDVSLQSVASFDSQISGAMQQRAIVAMMLSLLVVVAYIWLRFGSLRYGIAAILALVHDVSIALGLLAISGWLVDTGIGHGLLLSDFKIDLAIVAAMLTIVGYSLNDTIVVFDRVRENRGKLAVATPEIINHSINQTISRTILTSGTTFLAVLILYVFGGPGVHGFAFAMLIGVLVGTYSSIAIASPALVIGAKKQIEEAKAKALRTPTTGEQPSAT